MREISPEVHAYAQDVIRRLSKVEFPKTTRIMGGRSDKLGKQDFEQLPELLAKLKKENGPLGRHINNLTKEIIDTGKDLEPTLRSLQKLEAEIDGEFWRFRGIRSLTGNLGSILTRAAEINPDYSSPSLSAFSWVCGVGAELLAKYQPEEFEVTPVLFHSRPRRLYADWKKVKKALINPSSE